jgi:SSS family solute:Na+ symporter
MHLNTLDIIVIVLYMAMMSLIGLYFSRQQNSRIDFFLGGRSMHWILVGGSLSIFSTISFMSVPGEMIRYGLGYFVAYLIVPLVIPVINWLVLPVLMRLQIGSPYEYLEKRFGSGIKGLSSYIFVLKTVLYMGVVIYTASLAISEVTGWSILLIISIIGLVTTFYTSAGGLRTVIWTDFIQTLLFTGCALVIPIFIWSSTGRGPSSWWSTFSLAGRAEIQTFSLDPTVRITTVGNMISIFFWFFCTTGSDQMVVQRYLSTPSIKAARRSLWTSTLSTLLSILFLIICGLSLFAFYEGRSSTSPQAFQQQVGLHADRVMPQFIAQELPHGVSGLIIAGLLAAAMAGLSSGMNATASVIIGDLAPRLSLYRIFSIPLVLERLTGVVVGAAGIGLAVGITLTLQRIDWNLVELSHRINHLLIGPLAVLFFSGILLRRAVGGSVTVGFLVSTAVSVFISYGKQLFGFEQSISFMWVIPCSFVIGVLTTGFVSYLFKPPDELAIRNLTVKRESVQM